MPIRSWLATAVFALAFTPLAAFAQSNFTWSNGGTSTWEQSSSWQQTAGPGNGLNYPGALGLTGNTDIALITGSPSPSSANLTLFPPASQFSLGAITTTTAINNFTPFSGTLRFNGATVNGVPNTIYDVTANFSHGQSNSTIALGSLVSRIQVGPSAILTFNPQFTEVNANSVITKTGDGTLRLIRASSYTGGTNIDGGVLQVNNVSALGTSGTITFGGGIIEYLTSADHSSRFSAAANQHFQVRTSTNSVSFNSNFGSSGSTLTKTGLSTLLLNGTNNFPAGVNINQGVLRITNVNALGSVGTISFAGGGQLDFGGGVTNTGFDVSSRLSSAPGQVYDLINNSGNGITLASPITSTGGSLRLANGTFILNGNNTYDGGTTLLNGVSVELGHPNALGTTGTIGTVNSSFQLRHTAANTVDYSSRLSTASNQTFVIDTNGQNLTYATGMTSADGGFGKSGSGELLLSGNNSFSYVYVDGGVLRLMGTNTISSAQANGAGSVISLESPGAIGSGGGADSLFVIFGATLRYSASNTIDYSARLAGGYDPIIDTNGQNVTFASNMNHRLLTKTGAGTLALAGSNTFVNNTTATNPVVILKGGILRLDNANAMIFTGISFGTIQFSGGILQYSASNTIDFSSRFNQQSNHPIAIDTNGQFVTFASPLTSFGGTLTKYGAGTLLLTASNVYTGATTVNEGTLQAGSGAAFGGNTTMTVATLGTLDLNNNSLSIGSLAGSGTVLLGSAILTVGGNNTNTTFSGTLNVGTGGVTKLGSGTLTLSGTVINPAITISAGAINLQSALSGGPSNGILVGPSGSLIANATAGISVTGTGPTAVIAVNTSGIDLGDNTSFIGFNHQGVLTIGANTVKLKSASFASLGANTIMAGGNIIAANGVAFGSGSNLNATGTIAGKVGGSAGSVLNAIGGNLNLGADVLGGFVHHGELNTAGNTVTLSSLNRATLGSVTTLGQVVTPGTLTVANGAFLDFARAIGGYGTINSTNALPQAMIINGDVYGNDATHRITFTGYVKGVGTFNNTTMNGTFSPGLSPTITYTSNLGFGSASKLEIEIGGTTPGSGHDKIIDSGTLVLDGTLRLVLINGFNPSPTDTFDILDFTNLFGTFSAYDFTNAPAPAGYGWDITALYTTGVLSFSIVPEPALLGLLAGAPFLFLRRRT